MVNTAPEVHLTLADLQNLVTGSAILGCGGGGPVMAGKAFVETIDRSGQPVRLVKVDDIPDDAQLAVAAVMGAPDAGDTADAQELLEATVDGLRRAFVRLDQWLIATKGRGIDYGLPLEIGAGNSLVPMLVGALTSKPVVDAAGANRAVPSLTMCTYAAEAFQIYPVVL